MRRQALDEVSRPISVRPASHTGVWLMAGVLAVGATALAAVLALRPPSSRITGGDVALLNGAGSRIEDGAHLAARRGGELLLDGARVALSEGGEVWWRAEDHTLVLERGRVHVEVDPARHQRFAVQTSRFRVDVLGTIFEVDLSGVRTRRGKVKVSLGGVQVAEVSAGGSWTVPAPAPPVETAPAAAETAPAAAETAPAAAETAPPAVQIAPRRHQGEELAARLQRARRALAGGDSALARSILEPVRRGPKALLAEARLLEAESYLVERRYPQAIAGYRGVLRRFGDTEYGESALYAIAQLEVDSGRADAAERALHRYLDRYPRGRFAEEARSRLAALLGR